MTHPDFTFYSMSHSFEHIRLDSLYDLFFHFMRSGFLQRLSMFMEKCHHHLHMVHRPLLPLGHDHQQLESSCSRTSYWNKFFYLHSIWENRPQTKAYLSAFFGNHHYIRAEKLTYIPLARNHLVLEYDKPAVRTLFYSWSLNSVADCVSFWYLRWVGRSWIIWSLFLVDIP